MVLFTIDKIGLNEIFAVSFFIAMGFVSGAFAWMLWDFIVWLLKQIVDFLLEKLQAYS